MEYVDAADVADEFSGAYAVGGFERLHELAIGRIVYVRKWRFSSAAMSSTALRL
jgi:hypothetical protein